MGRGFCYFPASIWQFCYEYVFSCRTGNASGRLASILGFVFPGSRPGQYYLCAILDADVGL